MDVSATNLKGALAPMESAVDCAVGLAFTEGKRVAVQRPLHARRRELREPHDQPGSGTVTVTGPGSFEIDLRPAFAAVSLANFYDLAEDPGRRLYDLAGKPSANMYGLFHSAVTIGGTQYVTGTNNAGAKLRSARSDGDARARPPGGLLPERLRHHHPGRDQGASETTASTAERVALRWNRRTTTAVPDSETTRWRSPCAGRSPPSRDTAEFLQRKRHVRLPGPATETSSWRQREVAPGVRTDFLAILNERLARIRTGQRRRADRNITSRYHAWRDDLTDRHARCRSRRQPSESWNFLIYYKPTSFLTTPTRRSPRAAATTACRARRPCGPRREPWLRREREHGRRATTSTRRKRPTR